MLMFPGERAHGIRLYNNTEPHSLTEHDIQHGPRKNINYLCGVWEYSPPYFTRMFLERWMIERNTNRWFSVRLWYLQCLAMEILQSCTKLSKSSYAKRLTVKYICVWIKAKSLSTMPYISHLLLRIMFPKLSIAHHLYTKLTHFSNTEY